MTLNYLDSLALELSESPAMMTTRALRCRMFLETAPLAPMALEMGSRIAHDEVSDERARLPVPALGENETWPRNVTTSSTIPKPLARTA